MTRDTIMTGNEIQHVDMKAQERYVTSRLADFDVRERRHDRNMIVFIMLYVTAFGVMYLIS